MKTIGLAKVESFVKTGLKRRLQRDLRRIKILKEGDVECCSYYHLRKFLKPDPEWRIFARKFSRKTGYYTDLVIFRGLKARIAIEIKWGKKEISKKDRKALASARKKLKVKKTYFYNVMPDTSIYTKAEKLKVEKYRMFERIVDLGYITKANIEEFKRRRKQFRV